MAFCRRSETDLILYLYGELDGEGKAGFEDHLTGCAQCRAEAEILRGTAERWRRDAPEITAPRRCVDRALRGRRRRGPGTLLRRGIEGLLEGLWPESIMKPSWRPSAAAAAGALAVAAALLVVAIYYNPAERQAQAPRTAASWDNRLAAEIEALRVRVDRLSGKKPWQGALFQAGIDHRLDRLDRQIEGLGFPGLMALEIDGLDKIHLRIDEMELLSVL